MTRMIVIQVSADTGPIDQPEGLPQHGHSNQLYTHWAVAETVGLRNATAFIAAATGTDPVLEERDTPVPGEREWGAPGYLDDRPTVLMSELQVWGPDDDVEEWG